MRRCPTRNQRTNHRDDLPLLGEGKDGVLWQAYKRRHDGHNTDPLQVRGTRRTSFKNPLRRVLITPPCRPRGCSLAPMTTASAHFYFPFFPLVLDPLERGEE